MVRMPKFQMNVGLCLDETDTFNLDSCISSTRRTFFNVSLIIVSSLFTLLYFSILIL